MSTVQFDLLSIHCLSSSPSWELRRPVFGSKQHFTSIEKHSSTDRSPTTAPQYLISVVLLNQTQHKLSMVNETQQPSSKTDMTSCINYTYNEQCRMSHLIYIFEKKSSIFTALYTYLLHGAEPLLKS